MIALVVGLLVVVVLAGGLPEGRLATGTQAPDWLQGIGAFLGPRRLTSEDLGGGTICSSALGRALEGEQSFALSTAGACVIEVPLAEGFLVRPRGVRLRVESGAMSMTVVQRGRGNSLTMDESFGPGDEPKVSFGERGGTIRLTCFSGCVLTFPR